MNVNWITKIPSYIPSAARTHSPIQDYNDYVYFSDNTKGHSGKVVKIKVGLFSRFAALVNPHTCDGQTIIRQLEALRASNCAGPGVHTDTQSAFRYMLKVKNMQVFYAILDGKDKGKKEIFIGDIKADFAAGPNKAGLYALNTVTNKMVPNAAAELDQKIVYLNGQCDNMLDAVEKATTALEIPVADTNLRVFYTPGNIINNLGVWSSTTQSQETKDVITQLRNIINLNNKKRVLWVAEGEGADIFSKALDSVTGSLATYRFRLIDPVTNTPALLQKLQTKEIKPTTSEVAPVQYTGKNRTATLSIEACKQVLIDSMKQLKVTGYTVDVHQEAIASLEASGNTHLGSNARQLQDTAALNKRLIPPSVAQPKHNMAALSFVQALRRV